MKKKKKKKKKTKKKKKKKQKKKKQTTKTNKQKNKHTNITYETIDAQTKKDCHGGTALDWPVEKKYWRSGRGGLSEF